MSTWRSAAWTRRLPRTNSWCSWATVDGTFAAPILVNLGDFAPSNAVSGDFTGDGLDDLLIEGTNPSFQTVFELFKGDRNGTFGAPTPINLAGLALGQSAETAAGDFTGIGHDELAVVGLICRHSWGTARYPRWQPWSCRSIKTGRQPAWPRPIWGQVSSATSPWVTSAAAGSRVLPSSLRTLIHQRNTWKN